YPTYGPEPLLAREPFAVRSHPHSEWALAQVPLTETGANGLKKALKRVEIRDSPCDRNNQRASRRNAVSGGGNRRREQHTCPGAGGPSGVAGGGYRRAHRWRRQADAFRCRLEPKD